MKKYLSAYAYLFTIAGMVVLLDQLTKSLVRNNLTYGEIYHPEWWLTQYLRIVHWSNTGAAFGLFKSLGPAITVLSFVVGAAILYYFPQIPREDWPLRLALSLQLGGALGNLTDRLMHGQVTDFISFLEFPVFNIADASITFGVVILVLSMWLSERKAKKAKEKETPPGDDEAQLRDPFLSRLPEETQGE